MQVPHPPTETPIVVAAFYKFVRLNDYEARRGPLQSFCLKHKILGTILLAEEGINGTVASDLAGITALMNHFSETLEFSDITAKFSYAKEQAFHRMKVRLKAEIVAMGQPEIDPLATGKYIAPKDWNALIARDDTLVIDTRNHYEVAIGTFARAIDPHTERFREFPDWVDNYLAKLPEDKKPKNIAMFCTGGIRCEKATAYLVSQGYDNVYHLEGGILKYLEEVTPTQSLWRGDCFVFDQRVSVGNGVLVGDYDLCHACRMPISEEDKTHSAYEEGVSCPHCIEKRDDAARLRFRERQKQIALARTRGKNHIGQK